MYNFDLINTITPILYTQRCANATNILYTQLCAVYNRFIIYTTDQTTLCICNEYLIYTTLCSMQQTYYIHNVVQMQLISLKITNRSFRYAAPCLWNELPTELRLPRHTQSSPPSPSVAHSSSSPPLSPPSPLSVTTSVFHSELKTWLFGKSFPP